MLFFFYWYIKKLKPENATKAKLSNLLSAAFFTVFFGILVIVVIG